MQEMEIRILFEADIFLSLLSLELVDEGHDATYE